MIIVQTRVPTASIETRNIMCPQSGSAVTQGNAIRTPFRQWRLHVIIIINEIVTYIFNRTLTSRGFQIRCRRHGRRLL